MLYRKINFTQIYEQMQNIEGEGIVKNAPAAAEETSSEPKSAMYAFSMSESDVNSLKSLISNGKGIWVSPEPVRSWQSGKEGEPAQLDNKPTHIAVRISNKNERAANEVQLQDADKSYVLFNTSADELQGILDKAKDIANRVRIAVKTPTGGEHSVLMWREKEGLEAPEMNQEEAGTETVSVDLQAQIDNPGTSAGIGESKIIPSFSEFNKAALNEKIEKQKSSDFSLKKIQRKGSPDKARYIFKSKSGKEILQPDGHLLKDAYNFLKDALAKEGYSKRDIKELDLRRVKKGSIKDKLVFNITRRYHAEEDIEKAADSKTIEKIKPRDVQLMKSDIKREVVKELPKKQEPLIAKAPEKSNILKPGSKETKKIEALQNKLDYILDMKVEADGAYGPETKAAVVAFQKKAFPSDKKEWDGAAGPKTLAALDAAVEKEQRMASYKAKKQKSTVDAPPINNVAAADSTRVAKNYNI